MDDLSLTIGLQRDVWQMDDVEVAPPSLLCAIVHSGGGSVLAAEIDGRLVGFCIGFAALRNDEWWLWSHMTGVHPTLQERGIGYRLKQAQREWALANGYRRMAWTFDPMQSGNANFNFNHLGVRACNYTINHYGVMDGINAGLASDRLEAQWQLDAPHVLALARGERIHGAEDYDTVERLVFQDDQLAIHSCLPSRFDAAQYRIEVPVDIARLKRDDIELAKTWQLQLRAAMMALLHAGYIVSALERAGGRTHYVLSRGTSAEA